MAARGRKSTAALSVVSHMPSAARPASAPPGDLPAEAAAIWRETLRALPADWLPVEAHAVLKQYCRHVLRCSRVARLVEMAEAADPFDLKEYRELLAEEERQSRIVAALATRLRLTPQARQRADRARPAGSAASAYSGIANDDR